MGQNVVNADVSYVEGGSRRWGMWWGQTSTGDHYCYEVGRQRLSELRASALTSGQTLSGWIGSMTSAEQSWITAQPLAARSEMFAALKLCGLG